MRILGLLASRVRLEFAAYLVERVRNEGRQKKDQGRSQVIAYQYQPAFINNLVIIRKKSSLSYYRRVMDSSNV